MHVTICKSFVCLSPSLNEPTLVHTVTAHPTDPQARMGLKRCMDVLHLMEVLWPSACRALELICGSKDNEEFSNVLTSTSAAARRKRSAEQVLIDNDTFHRPAPSDHSMDHNYVQLRPPYSSQYTNFAAYTTNGHEIHPHPSPPPGQDPNVSSSYDRWTPENNSHSFGFSGTLSTSVLPQLYSTGLVGDRGGGHRTAHINHPEQSRTSSNTSRYQQYWNDFSAYPQLGTYGGYHEPSPVSHQQQQPQHQGYSASSQTYIPGPYSTYSELSSSRMLQTTLTPTQINPQDNHCLVSFGLLSTTCILAFKINYSGHVHTQALLGMPGIAVSITTYLLSSHVLNRTSMP